MDTSLQSHKQPEVPNANSGEDEDGDGDGEGDINFEELSRALFQAGTLPSKTKTKKQRRKRQHKRPASSPHPVPTTPLRNDMPGINKLRNESPIWFLKL